MVPAVRVENLGKSYRLGLTHAHSVRELVNSAVAKFFRRKNQARSLPTVAHDQAHRLDDEGLFWALRDVSFEVQAGEVVGIIGKNGAGKSTLLKILSRITPPTTGRVSLRGRVASLLEVGTGFHPELTGRENVYLNGTILGMTRKEVARKLDQIVDFAGVEEFMDTPVKRYSSGMAVRLGFAVAAHLEPEILIVDEVLAVGDYEFQQKCLGKMQQVAGDGRTVLFVSHNMSAVQRLTSRSILLLDGTCQFQGPTSEAVERYLNHRTSHSSTTYNVEGRPRDYPGLNLDLEILQLRILNPEAPMLPADSPVQVELTIRAKHPVKAFRVSATIFQQDEMPVGNTFSNLLTPPTTGQKATYHLTFDRLRLAEGKYHCALSVGVERTRGSFDVFDVIFDVLHFEVLAASQDYGFVEKWHPGWGPIRLDPIVVVDA